MLTERTKIFWSNKLNVYEIVTKYSTYSKIICSRVNTVQGVSKIFKFYSSENLCFTYNMLKTFLQNRFFCCTYPSIRFFTVLYVLVYRLTKDLLYPTYVLCTYVSIHYRDSITRFLMLSILPNIFFCPTF